MNKYPSLWFIRLLFCLSLSYGYAQNSIPYTSLAFIAIDDYIESEIDIKSHESIDQETDSGFESLFNGEDFDQWTGNKTDYIV